MKDCDATEVDEHSNCPNCHHKDGDNEESNKPPAKPVNTPSTSVSPSPEEIGSVKALGDTGTELPGVDHDTDIKLGSVVPHVTQTVPSVHKAVHLSKVSKRNGSNLISHKPTSLEELKNVTRLIVEDMCR